MKKILISGFYGFGNGGDEAVLSGIIKALGAASLKDITVLSSDPGYTESLHKVKAAPRSSAKTLKAIRDCDIFISGGGSLFQNATSNRSLYYYLALLKAAKLMGKKTVVFAQGIGPLEGGSVIRRTVNVLKSADLVSVRDAESEGFLKSFGIAASLVPDPAFLCRKEPADGLPGIAGIKKDYFVICPRPYKDNSYLAPLRKAVSVYAEKTASTPLLVPMFGSEDMLIPGIAAADPDTGFARQKGLIAGARLLIGVRLHSMIFAASENVPFVSVSYDPKTESFARANGITPLDINALQTETLLYEMQNARAASGKPDTDKLFAFAERIGEL